jgi:hypothetical protein
MSRSLFAAIHNAVVGPVDDALDEGETGAAAQIPPTKESTMSKDSPPAGGVLQAGTITQAEHEAAVNSARAEGKAEGEKSASSRLNAALGADGVKGDAGRMGAALDLAGKSPNMSGEDVAAFVVANVAASTVKPPAGASADKYAADRVAAAGLAQPQGGDTGKKATIDTGGIYASRRKQQEG